MRVVSYLVTYEEKDKYAKKKKHLVFVVFIYRGEVVMNRSRNGIPRQQSYLACQIK